MATTKVEFENETFVGRELLETEKQILTDQTANMMAAPDSFCSWLLENNFPKVQGALEVAKERFDAPFTGISAGDSEIGIQKIRPGHILRIDNAPTGTPSTETPSNSWKSSAVSPTAFTAGLDYWIGWGAGNTTAVNIDRELCILPLAIGFTQGVAPVVEELVIKVGGTEYPVQVARDAWFADNKFGIRVTPIRPFLLSPKATCLVQVHSIAASTDQELVLLGVTFGLGRKLRKATYTAVDL